MGSEGKHIQALLIPDSSKGIRGSNDLATMLLEDLCRPGTHIAEALHATILWIVSPKRQLLPAAAFAAGQLTGVTS